MDLTSRPDHSGNLVTRDSSHSIYGVTWGNVQKAGQQLAIPSGAVIHFTDMAKYRPSLANLAQALLLFVLFNSMACSIGHGQMLQKMFAPNEPTQSYQAMSMGHFMVMDHSPHTMSQTSTSRDMPPMHGMDSIFGDCFFAASLPLGLMLFSVLTWLLRRRRPRPVPRWLAPLSLPTALLLSLQPRAP